MVELQQRLGDAELDTDRERQPREHAVERVGRERAEQREAQVLVAERARVRAERERVEQRACEGQTRDDFIGLLTSLFL